MYIVGRYLTWIHILKSTGQDRTGQDKDGMKEISRLPKCGGGFQIKLLWFGNAVSWGLYIPR